MVIERCDGIRPNSEVKRLAQRKQPGKPHHNIPGQTRVSEKQKQGRKRNGVRAGPQGQNHQQPENTKEQEKRAPVHSFSAIRPRGRNIRTMIISAKLIMLFADGAIKNPPSASETPIRTPPTSAPLIEPNPPTITMTNASRV